MSREKSIRIRGGHRAYVSKIIEIANETLQHFSESASEREKLESFKVTLKDKREVLKSIDEKILESTKEEDISKEIIEASEIGESINRICVRINNALNPANNVSSPSTDNSESVANSNPINTSTPTIKAKLPKLTLRKFSGDPKSWQPFWDSFEAAVHNNDSVSKIDKSNYLKSLVEGNAASAIDGFALTADNYESAVKVLKDRFADPQIIISSHMEELLNLPAISDIHKVSKIRQLYDSIETHIRSLRNLGIDYNSYGSLLVPLIVSKLPEEMRLIVARNLGKNEWNIDKLLCKFKLELEARERCNTIPECSSPKSFESKSTRYRGRQPNSSSTLVSGKGPSLVPYCSYCSKQHASASCSIVTDITARRAILRRKGNCFLCLRSGHIIKQCESQYKCQKCGGHHHISICEENAIKPPVPGGKTSQQNESVGNHQSNQPQTKLETAQGTQTESSIIYVESNTAVLLQTAESLVGKVGSVMKAKHKARIVFDSCSQRSYISNRLSYTLNLETVESENLLIKTFGDEPPKVLACNRVKFAVTDTEGNEIVMDAYSVPTICSPISNQSIKVALEEYPHLHGLKFADNPSMPTDGDVEVEILIGADYYWKFVTGTTKRGGKPGPVAVLTRLGWVLSGPVIQENQGPPNCSPTTNLNATQVLRIDAEPIISNTSDQLHNQLEKLWDLETLGIRDQELTTESKFMEEITFNGKHEVKLPFREEHPLLPDHHTGSVKRLSSLLSRLKTNPNLLQEYDNIIQDQIKSGVVERANDVLVPVGNVHYLPHREVVREDKNTTKVRVVYDASARGPGTSLNDCLHTGPSLNTLIFDILIRFRVHKVAMIADIEKAFLNIAISPEHRDYLRFFWINDIHETNPNIITLRFARLLFGLTCSPAILNAVLHHHLTQYTTVDPTFVTKVLKSLYVDDLASGSDDTESALALAKKIKTRLSEGGFNMRKWLSNSKELMSEFQCDPQFSEEGPQQSPGLSSSVTEEDQGYSKSIFHPQQFDSHPRVLGQIWNPQTDTFIMLFSAALKNAESNTITKRSLLSVAAKFYDPLGLISPVTLRFKQMFQELCKSKVGWDEPLNDEFCEEWNQIVQKLKEASYMSIPRCYCPDSFHSPIKSTELHSFGDASESSYGACVYLRCEHSEGIHCDLIASKTRVAPMSKQTIPRLELLSSLLACRLTESVKKALDDVKSIDSVTYWSDSTVVLSWIRNSNKEFKQFVENRLREIRRLAPSELWKYVPTKQNPADIASRGTTATQLVGNKLWCNGPEFLVQSREHWPFQPCNYQGDDSELKSQGISITTSAVNVEKSPNIMELIDAKKYSCLGRLLRVTAYVLRFIGNLKKRVQRDDITVGPVTCEELDNAEMKWIKDIQNPMTQQANYRKVKDSLNLFEDKKNIIRCHGRIQESPLPYETKFPILLPSDHYFTRLIVLRSHEQVLHNGVRETLTQVRSKYWITKGRQVVKRILSKCLICKRLEGPPYGNPEAPPLPEFRLSNDFAFSKIGVDYAGPMYVKDIYSPSQDMHKVYISLYTCSSSRALHLDLVPDMSSEAFVRSLERFIGRRGIPSLIVSDNGKTFKGQEIKSFTASKNIKWRYIVEKSPWWGGFYERMVRSVKRCLKKVLRNARLTYEELLTLLIRVEGVLNSRPLTYVYPDRDEPLTPSHLVLGKRILSVPTQVEFDAEDEGKDELVKREKHLKNVLKHFWKRWKSEYLTQLREHHKPSKKHGPEIKVGEVVLIEEDNVKKIKLAHRGDRELTQREGWKRSSCNS